LDPADPIRVIGLNVLDGVDRGQRSLIVSSVISILRNLYPHNWGPRTEYILMHVLYALLDQSEPATFAAIPKLLTDHRYRQRIVSGIKDQAIRHFFRFFDTQNDRLREESIAPLLNKVAPFVANPLLRAVVGQTTSSFDFRWMMDNSKIFICN